MWCGDVRRRYGEECGAVQCTALQYNVVLRRRWKRDIIEEREREGRVE